MAKIEQIDFRSPASAPAEVTSPSARDAPPIAPIAPSPEVAPQEQPVDENAVARKRRRLRALLMIGGIAAVVVAGSITWLHGGRYVSTDDAYVHAAKLVGFHRRFGHRDVGGRPRGPARQGRRHSVPRRSPTVPDRARQRQGQPRADRAEHRSDEAGLQAHAERHRRAERRRSPWIRRPPTALRRWW